MKHFYFIIIHLFLFVPAWTQIAPGQWDLHLSMIDTKSVIDAGERIYFLSDRGIFYYNKTDNSIETLNKLDKLSGSDFMGLSYNETTRSVVVTYRNSCIDIIREDGHIYPILDIKRKNISGDKLIYNAVNYGKYCYLACGFGVVVADIEKLEIKDSYIIGPGGNSMPVYDIDFIDGYIFAGTKEGIKQAPLEGVNLLDFSNWTSVENSYLPNYEYTQLETGWNRLWIIHQSTGGWYSDRTFSRHAADIWYPEFPEYMVIRDFRFIGGNLVYCVAKPEVITQNGTDLLISNASVEIYNQQRERIINIDSYPFAQKGVEISPMSALIDNHGVVWIADKNYGGIRYENGNYTQLTPQGPFNNYVFSLTFSDNTLWTASGGVNAAWGNNWIGFNVNKLNNGKWESFNKINGALDRYIYDPFEIVAVPGNTNRFFASTWGYGLLEFENGKLKNVFNEKNSSLQSIIANDYYVRIGGLDFDSKGNLWMSNTRVEKCLHKMSPNGEWTGYTLPEIAFNYDAGKILVTQNDDIWMTVPRNKTKGLYIMSNDGEKKRHLDVSNKFDGFDQQNKPVTIITPMNDVYSLAQDSEGVIWVGTSSGILVYNSPERVFEQTDFYAIQPGVDLNDGIYHPLLENVTVTAIAVDGGNRKWCGTKTNGVFLISADGQNEIEHFTTENSPLISDNITSLAYDGTTGILYIGTLQGLVSYRTDSKNPNESFSKVYAYPNPVRENYTGNIYITGLVYDTNVKITTVSGRLVFETTSQGAQAVWDGRDLAGNRVHTGVYLAYCASPNGTSSAVTKILFIR
jgi:hypothetical protein